MHLLYQEGQVRYPQEFHVICNGLLLIADYTYKVSYFYIFD